MMKILYLNHICWEWIFQRPQILALALEKDYECIVLNKKYILGKRIVSRNPMPKNNKYVYQLPRESTCKLLYKVNEWIYKKAVKRNIDCDAIWICHPLLFKYVPKDFSKMVIYDCMDDHMAMSSTSVNAELELLEKALIERADLNIVSSDYLRKKRFGDKSVCLVRNGVNLPRTVVFAKGVQCKNTYKIGYIGTISDWFDIDILKKSISTMENIEYHLIGPIAQSVISDNWFDKKIIYEGIKEHDSLLEITQDYDALVMPFKICDIVLSVDPVKLYEYISFGKCILSVYYPELERFRPYVYFYETQEDYCLLLNSLIEKGFPAKYSKEEQIHFLQKNTWEQRYDVIHNELKKLCD